MALKWISALVAVAAATVIVTANIIIELFTPDSVPVVVNLVLVAMVATGVTLLIVASLYQRVDARIGVLSDFLVLRLEELEGRIGDRNTGLVEGVLSRPPTPGEAAVVPMPTRMARRQEP